MDLDQKDIYAIYDPGKMIKFIDDFPKQIHDCLTSVQKQVLPSYYLNIERIVIVAMGGSAIAGDIIADLIKEECKIPVFVHRDYNLPGFVDSKTLVIAISHSGNTEETLDAFITGFQKKAKLFGIGTGGQLQSLARKYKAPFFKIDYDSPPRYALGYYLVALLWLFKKINVYEFSLSEMEKTVILLQKLKTKLNVDSPTRANMAKSLALNLNGVIPIIIGSGLLQNLARRMKTDLNENAKVAAFYEILPEQNHNGIAGLDFPKGLAEMVFFVIIESKFAHPRIRLRENVLTEILEKKQIPYKRILVEPTGSKLTEIAATIMFSNYLSYYSAILNQVDPRQILSVDLLKKRLKDEA